MLSVKIYSVPRRGGDTPLYKGCLRRFGLKTGIECFHMTSRRPYWCPKTMKRQPCWCSKPVLWELNSFLMQTPSFVPINLHRCWPREWKHSIHFARFGLETGIVFEGTTVVYKRINHLNSKWVTLKEREILCEFEMDLKNFFADALI